MKLFPLILILIISGCSQSIDENQKWMIKIDLSGTNFTCDNIVYYDSLLRSDYTIFKLPQMHCSIENIDFQPEFRIYDKYSTSDKIDYQQIFDTLYLCLQNRFEVLQSKMYPDDYGQLFDFIIKSESRYIYQYHLIDSENRNFLILTISTFGTRGEILNDFKILIDRIKLIIK